MKQLKKSEASMKTRQNRYYAMVSQLFLVFNFWNIGLSANTASHRPETRIDAAGNIIAVWEGTDPITAHSVIQANYIESGGNATGVVALSPSSDYSIKPKLAVNNNGDAVAIWLDTDPNGNTTLMGSIKPLNQSSWGPSQLISSTDTFLNNYEVSLNENGNIVGSWEGYINLTLTSVIRISTATVAVGVWSAPQTISP